MDLVYTYSHLICITCFPKYTCFFSLLLYTSRYLSKENEPRSAIVSMKEITAPARYVYRN